jgi:hypothetical protein
MLSGINLQPTTMVAPPPPFRMGPVRAMSAPSLSADRFIIEKPVPPPPDPNAPPLDPPPSRIWPTLRTIGTFALPTAVGAGLGLGIAAATGASLGVGALIGAGVGLAAVVGVVAFALYRWGKG